MLPKLDLSSINAWACCDWPRRATIAEYKNIQLTQMLARIRVALDTRDTVCPCCDKSISIVEHAPACIVFEIDRLLNDQDEDPTS